MRTSNDFAILLLFYYYYQRNKIEYDSLRKVLTKYTKKQFIGRLLIDLYQKYPSQYYSHLQEVDYTEVIYIIQKYQNQIPKEYLTILQKDYDGLVALEAKKSDESEKIHFLSLRPYDPLTDIYHPDFHPEKLLLDYKAYPLLCGVDLQLFPPHDNLSKVSTRLPSVAVLSEEKLEGSRHKIAYLPEDYLKQSSEEILNSLLVQFSRKDTIIDPFPLDEEGEEVAQKQATEEDNTQHLVAMEINDQTSLSVQPRYNSFQNVYTKKKEDIEKELIRKKTLEEQRKRPILEIIAERSIPKYISSNSLGEKTEIASPLQLLSTFMQAKARVRIVTRHRNHLRGSIDAFIVGFDKFMNLYLKDCDEEYVTTTQQGKKKKNFFWADIRHQVCFKDIYRK